MIKIDLHTHSKASPDGGLSLEQYNKMLMTSRLDYIAVTDHNTITTALEIREKLGDRIIVGEEITTLDGDLIGLYLADVVPPGLSARETAIRIRNQGGIIYVPHPFEKIRKGIGSDMLLQLDNYIDIVEAYNGRSLTRNANMMAYHWAEAHNIPMAASSDAHGWLGWGKTYTCISERPDKLTLCPLLKHESASAQYIGGLGIFYPKVNRIRKKLQRGAGTDRTKKNE